MCNERQRHYINKKSFISLRRNSTLFIIVLIFTTMITFLFSGLTRAENKSSTTSGSLHTSLDRESAQMGTIATLTLDCQLPDELSLPADPGIKGLEDIAIIDRTITKNKITIRFIVDQIDWWKTGQLSLTCLDKDGKLQVLTTDPVSMKVLSNLGKETDKNQLKPIQDIIPAKPFWLQYMVWFLLLFGIILMVMGLLWWIRKRGNEPFTTLTKELPHIIATKEIENLVASEVFEKGNIKTFYFRFSEIMRCYIASIRNFPAAEYTTEEIARCITRGPDQSLLSLLRKFDLVKFANEIPSPERKEEEVKMALSYIGNTSPSSENNETPNSLKENTP